MGSARLFAPVARVALTLAVALAVAGVGASAATSDTSTPTNPKHFFWAGQTPSADSLQNDIIFHGGSAGPGAIGIEKTPAVYLVYWGTEWATGFTNSDTDGTPYSSATLQNYLNTRIQLYRDLARIVPVIDSCLHEREQRLIEIEGDEMGMLDRQDGHGKEERREKSAFSAGESRAQQVDPRA